MRLTVRRPDRLVSLVPFVSFFSLPHFAFFHLSRRAPSRKETLTDKPQPHCITAGIMSIFPSIIPGSATMANVPCIGNGRRTMEGCILDPEIASRAVVGFDCCECDR